VTHPSRNYTVYAAGQYVCEQQSLIAASIAARQGAADHPGVMYQVEREGRAEATYEQTRGGHMKAWVR
jgi:hypothetical protein